MRQIPFIHSQDADECALCDSPSESFSRGHRGKKLRTERPKGRSGRGLRPVAAFGHRTGIGEARVPRKRPCRRFPEVRTARGAGRDDLPPRSFGSPWGGRAARRRSSQEGPRDEALDPSGREALRNATPELVRQDRGRRSPKDPIPRTPANPCSAQWGLAAMPAPISHLEPEVGSTPLTERRCCSSYRAPHA